MNRGACSGLFFKQECAEGLGGVPAEFTAALRGDGLFVCLGERHFVAAHEKRVLQGFLGPSAGAELSCGDI